MFLVNRVYVKKPSLEEQFQDTAELDLTSNNIIHTLKVKT